MKAIISRKSLIEYIRTTASSFTQMATEGHILTEIALPDFIELEVEPIDVKETIDEWN